MAAANIYSLIMTAKANQLDPYRYLRYLLENCRCAKQISSGSYIISTSLQSRITSRFKIN